MAKKLADRLTGPEAALLKNATMLVNFVTPDNDGIIPASSASPEAAFATVGYRAGRVLSLSRKVLRAKAASKGCKKVKASL